MLGVGKKSPIDLGLWDQTEFSPKSLFQVGKEFQGNKCPLTVCFYIFNSKENI